MVVKQQRLRGTTNPWSLARTLPDLWLDASRNIGTVGSRTFDGVDQKFLLPTVPVFGTGDFTIECWAKIDTQRGQVFIGCRGLVGVAGVTVYQRAATSFLSITLSDGVASVTADSAIVGVVGKWYHIVGVVDRAADTVSLYVDGALAVAGASIATINGSMTPLYAALGNDPTLTTVPFDGSLSRARIAVGYAYTPTDVLESYNLGNGKFFAELSPALAARVTYNWNLNESAGNAIDCVGTNHGVPTGTSTTIASGAGPREATASDLVGGFHGTLTGFADTVTPWSSDTPDGSYTRYKADSGRTLDGAELLANRDFALGSGTAATNWTFAAGAGNTIVAEAGVGVGGSRAIHATVVDSVTGAYIEQTGVATLGRTYTVTFSARRATGVATQIFMTRPFVGPTLTLTDDWQTFTATGVATETAVLISRVATGEFFIDDVSLVESTSTAQMTNFADVDAAHVDSPEGSWGPHIPDEGSGGNDGWLIGGVADSRSADVPSGRFVGGAEICFDEQYQEPQATGARLFVRANNERFNLTTKFNPGVNDFFFAGWVKTGTIADGDYQTLFVTGGTTATTSGFWLVIYRTSTAYYLRAYFCDEDGVATASKVIHSLSTAELGAWIHVVAYADRTSGTVTAYINGAKSVTDPLDISGYAGPCTPEGANSQIGGYSTTLHHFDGGMSCLLLGVGSLDKNDIAILYGGGKPCKYVDLPSAQKAKVAYAYDCDEVAGDLIDSSGNGNTGVDMNTVGSAPGPYLPAFDAALTGFTSSPRGDDVPTVLAGKCKSITCVNNAYATTGTKTVTGQGARTVSFWFKRDGNPAASEYILTETQVAYANRGFSSYATTAGAIVVTILNANGSTALASRSSASGLCDNQWHHVVMTWDGTTDSGQFNIWVDGVAGSPSTAIATTQGGESTYSLQIGGYNGTTGGEFLGSLCRPQVFAGRALTPAEIATLYAGGDVTDGLTAEWRFMEDDSCGLDVEYSLRGDGANTAVDCGHEVIGAGNVTISAWINVAAMGETNYGRVVDNGKLYISVGATEGIIRVSSDGITEDLGLHTASVRRYSLNKWAHIAVVRYSDGHAEVFTDGVRMGRTKSSTWIGTTGYPAVGTANLHIANRANQERAFDGRIASVSVIPAILTQAEIRQLALGRPVGSPVGDWTFDERLSLPYLSGCKAISFDGSNDYITTGAPTLTGQGARSVAFWFRRMTTPASSEYLVAEASSSVANRGFSCYMASTGLIYATVNDGSAAIHPVLFGPANYCDGAWHHFAYSWDGTTNAGAAKLFIDGVLVDSDTATVTTQGGASAYNLNIAAANGGTNFGGSIADVRVYAGAALTQAQVRSLITGTDFTTGQTSRWKFGETPRSIASCAGGYSLDLNGTSDYVSMGDVLNIGTGDYSAAIWVKTSVAASSLAVSYIGKNIVGVASDGRWTLGRNPTANVARIYCRSNGLDKLVAGTTTINDGAWHHIAATLDRDDMMRLYVDGVEEGTATSIAAGSAGNWTLTQAFEIGRYFGSSGGYPAYADAMLDDARIYRSVLSAADIALLAAGGEPATAPTARWTLDDGPQYGEPSNGDPISLWESRDSERYEFEQATAAARPTYVQSGLNGKPGLAFDGVAQYLRYGKPILTGKEGTIVIVTDVTGLAAVGTFLAQCDESDSTYYARVSIMSIRQNRILQSAHDTPDDLRGATAFTTAVLALRSDGTTHSARVNGAADALTAAGGSNNGDWFGDSTGLDNTTIGTALHATASSFLDGTIYEILAWDRHLADGELAKVERYLATKYGITLGS